MTNAPEPAASPASDWSKPAAVTALDIAFPANVIGRLLPPRDTIPSEFMRWHGTPWSKQAETWFFSGVDLPASTVKPKPGIDTKRAFAHLRACLGSFEPQHEHKIGGVGYLMSLWFDELVLVGAKKAGRG